MRPKSKNQILLLPTSTRKPPNLRKNYPTKNVTVYLDENNNTRDKYGRLLAYVKLPVRRFLNEVMLSEGFAYTDWRFHHSLYHKYKKLEAAARRQKKGLWLNVTLEQMPEWRQQKMPNIKIQTAK
jgi:endonuclease YncB( thermonuclease family)